MSTPDWQSDDGAIQLYCADCLDVLPTLASGSVDAVVTDPPYGVNLGNHASANEKRPQWQSKKGYESYVDSSENFDKVVVPAINSALSLAGRGAVFCADTMMWRLPIPAAVGGVYLPAGNGRCAWGFQNLSHVLLYGSCPDLNLGAKHIVLRSVEGAEPSNHPCPKPLGWMGWIVGLSSRLGETVLDPFMGSGTTGVACVQTGRKFIGIEIDRGYFDIAKRRIQAAIAEVSQRFDFAKPQRAEQLTLIGADE